MATPPIKLPADLAAFLSGASEADIGRAESLINALQNLRVQITVNGVAAIGVIQFSGDSAVIVVNL